MRRWLSFLAISAILASCANNGLFKPRSQYPPDPWVKGYANDKDCLGGEALAARQFDLPDYPRRAFRSGRQGWVIMKLDVSAEGLTENVEVERSVPDGLFEGASRKAVRAWTFDPPKDGRLENCRVLFRFRAGEVQLGG
jgi:TonB family protein